MKKISSRQLIIFYIIYSFAVKFLMLPQFLSVSAVRDAWIAAAVGSIIELALLFIILGVLSSNKNDDIYGTLRNKIKPVGAKVVLFVLVMFFALQAFITLKQTSFMLNETLYEDLGFLAFAIPMLVLGVFFCYMQTRAVFRSGEIFFVFLIIALGLALLPSLDKIQLTEILPVFDKGTGGIWDAVYKNLIYFESGVFMLAFMGEIKMDRHFKRNFMLTAGVCAVIFTAFVVAFYALFGPLAHTKPLAIINVTQVSSYISQNGRLEWIMACVWLILLLLRFGVTFYCAFSCIRYITQINRFQPSAISFPLAVVFYALHAWVIISLTDLNKFVESLLPFILGFYIIVPLFFLALSVIPFTRLKQHKPKAKSANKQKGAQNV